MMTISTFVAYQIRRTQDLLAYLNEQGEREHLGREKCFYHALNDGRNFSELYAGLILSYGEFIHTN
jgi:hypothetical protein